ncbi:hypothetical protein P389DRAFT_188377 [Cystobasidium minutum MCA 4210]|uniref:uncharacterized protein n=1 Tax=Cystobasidium minutum MCA 4210 TaxID=1397322 RepID=UPI0034CF6581|eukprot:jgi/Rhomi1/188377/estExt_fgenesh1_pg.C_2_t20220
MPGFRKSDAEASEHLRESVVSNGSSFSTRSGPMTGNPTNLISVGSIALHDNLRCDILRSAISFLGSKRLASGQPSFATSRLSIFLKFVPVEMDENDTKLRATVTPPSNGRLEYVDARVVLRDSMDPSEAEYFNEPLHLADALGGDKHYERIIKAGSALTTDLRTANVNREDHPKPRPTGGFIVKSECPPVVGQLGTTWIDSPDMERPLMPKRALSQVQNQHKRSESAVSILSNISAPTEARSATSGCNGSHWECEACGSGTGEIIFCLRPAQQCSACNIRPLKLLHSGTKLASNDKQSALKTILPNKTLKLVTHLLNMDDGQTPDEFFAHFRIVFYFTDDESQDDACCHLREHVFRASIKIGKEGDAELQQKKEVDFNDALARLEGKVKLAAVPTGGRRAKAKAAKAAKVPKAVGAT